MEVGVDTGWAPPPHVPAALRIDGDPWQGLGEQPHSRMAKLHDGPAVRFARRHPLPNMAPHGVWIVAGAPEARSILLDAKSFISQGTTGVGPLIGEDLPLAPLESDGVDHRRLRAILHPFFQPTAVVRYEDSVRALASELIRDLMPRGGCDFVRDFAEKLPTRMFLAIMGLPPEHLPMFMDWEEAMMGRRSPQEMVGAFRALRDYMTDRIAERRTDLSDDLLSTIVGASLDGGPISDAEALGMSMLLFIAGLDTVVSTLSWQFRYLAEHPADQARLRADPAQIPAAIEELLRAYSITTVTRIATRDVEIGGVAIKQGDVVTCPTILGSRDPGEYAEPGVVDLDRNAKRHLAFGFGPHICLGMHLARMELRIAMELWLAATSSIKVADGGNVVCHGGISLGIDALPLTWSRL